MKLVDNFGQEINIGDVVLWKHRNKYLIINEIFFKNIAFCRWNYDAGEFIYGVGVYIRTTNIDGQTVGKRELCTGSFLSWDKKPDVLKTKGFERKNPKVLKKEWQINLKNIQGLLDVEPHEYEEEEEALAGLRELLNSSLEYSREELEAYIVDKLKLENQHIFDYLDKHLEGKNEH